MIQEKAYLFDFDGTLVDSMYAFCRAVDRLLGENGIKSSEEIIKAVTPLGYHGAAEHFRALGVEGSADEIVKLLQDYAYVEYAENIQAKEGVRDTLFEMKKRGLSLNVLTACPHRLLDVCLKRLNLFDLFDNVWSSDDYGIGKTNPEIYKMAAERLGKEVGEVIFVDDNVNAVKTARLAGVISYGIYDDSSRDFVEEMKDSADGFIERFEELGKFL